MMMTIEQLRKLAELNLCESCYKKYTILLEPQIKEWLSEPIGDWRQVETNINDIMMKAKGFVRKTDSATLSLDREAFFEEMAKDRWSFKRKIDSLHRQGVIKESVHDFLDKVRVIRNKIHGQNKFSKQDYSLFRQAKELTNAMVMPILFDLEDDVHQRLLARIENHAKQLLSRFKL